MRLTVIRLSESRTGQPESSRVFVPIHLRWQELRQVRCDGKAHPLFWQQRHAHLMGVEWLLNA